MTFRLPLEVFMRRMKISHLHPVLGTVSSRCAKKPVVRMTELVAALLTASEAVTRIMRKHNVPTMCHETTSLS